MIKCIHIKNFKSFGEVVLPLAKFNCLIGMNGTGKSTVLQVLDFISQMMIGQVQDWLVSRNCPKLSLVARPTENHYLAAVH